MPTSEARDHRPPSTNEAAVSQAHRDYHNRRAIPLRSPMCPECEQDALAAPTERRCPDDGTCHHECGLTGSCFRVVHAGPLSAAHYPGDRWPDDVRAANPPERLRGHL